MPYRLRRFIRLFVAAWLDVPRLRMDESIAHGLPNRHLIKAGYKDREEPAYDDQSAISANWQIGVYDEAVRIADELGAKRIVDLGCGDARKLAPLFSRFSVVGIDFGPNLDHCKRMYPHGKWIEHDLEGDGPLPLDRDMLIDSIVVCADVIEHLVRPAALLTKLHSVLRDAPVVLLSTPDRDLISGRRDSGPPRNKGHVREWTQNEFSFYLAANGFHNGTIQLVRSNDRSPERKTIMATLFDPRATTLSLAESSNGRAEG